MARDLYRFYSIKGYNDKKYKLTLFNCQRVNYENRVYSDKGSVNDEKLDNNLSRAKNKIFDYAYCNEWDYFITLTIDKSKYDRTDLQKYYKDFSKWINNKNRSANIQYILVPELHSDNVSWHMHGLIKGIPPNELSYNDNGFFDWLSYSNKFGFCSIDKIRSRERVSSYITKYVSKSLRDCIKSIGAHLYYCSKGLKLPQIIDEGLTTAMVSPDYKNDYVDVKYYSDISDFGFLIE